MILNNITDKCFICIIIIFIVIQQYAHAQESNKNQLIDTLEIHKSFKTITFYTWGMPNFGDSDTRISCEDSLRRKYGFTYKRVAGCVVTSKKARKWERHNKKCRRQMIQRHGQNWKKNYDREVNSCSLKTR